MPIFYGAKLFVGGNPGEGLKVRAVSVTISIGLALFDGERSHSAEIWLHNADAALYAAKAHGRDRVVASVAVR